jgi:hypothetical protein
MPAQSSACAEVRVESVPFMLHRGYRMLVSGGRGDRGRKRPRGARRSGILPGPVGDGVDGILGQPKEGRMVDA